MDKLVMLMTLFFFFSPLLKAQSGFEDSEGKSSIIYLESGGIGKINITDANIKLCYLHHVSDEYFRYGGEVMGKASNGISTLFEKKDIAPEAKIRASLGYQWILSAKPSGEVEEDNTMIVDDWTTIQVGYSHGQYRIVNPRNSFDHQIEKQKFDGFSIVGYYNLLFKHNFFLGVSIGLDRQNNYGSLEEVEVTDRTVTFDTSGFSRSIVTTESLRRGEFIVNNHFLANYDIMWIPGFLNYRMGIDLFGRYDRGGGNSNFKPGIGLFITEKGAPTKVVGGITFESVDHVLRIGLMTGINF